MIGFCTFRSALGCLKTNRRVFVSRLTSKHSTEPNPPLPHLDAHRQISHLTDIHADFRSRSRSLSVTNQTQWHWAHRYTRKLLQWSMNWSCGSWLSCWMAHIDHVSQQFVDLLSGRSLYFLWDSNSDSRVSKFKTVDFDSDSGLKIRLRFGLWDVLCDMLIAFLSMAKFFYIKGAQ